MEVKRRTVRTLVTKLGSVSEQTRMEAVCELRLISKTDSESRPVIAESDAIPYLADALYSSAQTLQENAAATLHNLSISCKDQLMSTRGFLDAISHALINPTSPFTAQCVAGTLYSLLMVESYRSLIGHKRDILFGLVDMVRCPGSCSRSIKDGLKALFGVALYPLNRAGLIDLGVVPALFSLVVKENRIGLVEDATAVISQIAACEEGWDEFREFSGVQILVDLLDSSTGSSMRIKENCVSALLNLVNCGGTEVSRSIRGMGLGLFDGIEDVAEDGSEKGKNKAVELMEKLFARGVELVDVEYESSSTRSWISSMCILDEMHHSLYSKRNIEMCRSV